MGSGRPVHQSLATSGTSGSQHQQRRPERGSGYHGSETQQGREASKKKLAIRLVWSGMAAACLLGALALAARYFSSSGLDNEQRFFPDDTRIVVSVKVDEILNSDGYKQLEEKVPFFREAFRDADPSSWVSLLTKDISRVTVAAFSLEDNVFLILKYKKGSSAGEFLAKGLLDGGVTKESIGPYTLYVTDRDFVFTIVDSKTVLTVIHPAPRANASNLR